MSEATRGIITGENTIPKMVKAKIIQARQTGLFIQVKDIHDKLRADGTNWNSRNMNSASTKEAVDGILAHIQRGGQLPAIVVQARPDGGVQKVDGYCRHAAYTLADASGLGELWVPIVPFLGTELEALAFISTSNKDTKINPMEQLDNYLRIKEQMIADGKEKVSLQDIADVVGVSRQYVDTILKLADLDDEGKAMVAEGKVAVGVAVKAVRADAAGATATLKKAQEAAAAQGSKKVTAKTAKAITVSTPLLLDMHQIGLNLRHNISKEAAATCEKFLKGDVKGDASITIPVRDVAMFLALMSEGDRQIDNAKAKAMAKADKAKQAEIPTTPPEDDKSHLPPQQEQRRDILDDQEAGCGMLADLEATDPEAPDQGEPEFPDTEDTSDFSFLG